MLSITSLAEDSQFVNSLSSIAYSLATYAESHDDLMQVALLHLLLLESEDAGTSRRNNRSWHLENCRLYLLDYLGRGRSIDSWKRHYARERLPDESDSMDSPDPNSSPQSADLPPDKGGPPWRNGDSDYDAAEKDRWQAAKEAVCNSPRSCKKCGGNLDEIWLRI